MKILFLCDNLGKGGKERRMIELIKGLSKYPEVSIELILFKKLIEYPEIYNLNIPLHIIERKPKYTPLTFLNVFKKCREIRPDIIHAWSSMTAIFVIPSIWLYNIKMLNGNIANAPQNLNFCKKKYILARLSFPYSKIVVGNSIAGLKAYHVPKSKGICIPNGFDFKRILKLENPGLIRDKYNLGTNFVIGKVAGFDDRKDYKTFITAAQQVLRAHESVIFFAIGNGPNFELIKNLVPQSIKEKIIFTGQIDDVESIINIFDIGILCTNSDIHGEGLSNSILEYMSLAKPVIATEGGGTNEIILENITGYLVPPKSSVVLADKILDLLENPIKAKQMGMAGRKRIEDHFSLDNMTSEYFHLYNRLIIE